jgi:hypothetical protein
MAAVTPTRRHDPDHSRFIHRRVHLRCHTPKYYLFRESNEIHQFAKMLNCPAIDPCVHTVDAKNAEADAGLAQSACGPQVATVVIMARSSNESHKLVTVT